MGININTLDLKDLKPLLLELTKFIKQYEDVVIHTFTASRVPLVSFSNNPIAKSVWTSCLNYLLAFLTNKKIHIKSDSDEDVPEIEKDSDILYKYFVYNSITTIGAKFYKTLLEQLINKQILLILNI